MSTMKVRVTLTIEVDPESWDMTYGVEPERIRTDVREYVLNQVQGSAASDEGAIVSVTLK